MNKVVLQKCILIGRIVKCKIQYINNNWNDDDDKDVNHYYC